MINKETETLFCKTCGRILAKDLEEWDDSLDLLCFGDASCIPPSKVSDGDD